MKMHVLAIDQGTSSTKALVVADSGEVVAESEVPVHPTAVGPHGVEQDAEELFQSIVQAGRAALASAGVRVDAVGLANQGETVVAWNSHGDAVSPAVSWQDRRSSLITDQMSGAAGRLREITGLALDPYFTGPKLKWLSDRTRDDVRVTGIDAWLNFRLFGECVTDAATASRSLLLDLESRAWSPEAVALFDLDLRALPDVVDCAGTFGETNAFGPSIPVTGLAVDQQAALIGEHCLSEGDAKCTYGTGAFLLVTTGRDALRSKSGLSTSVAWQYGDDFSYCLDGQVYAAGSALEWLRKLGLIRSFEDLDGVARQATRGAKVVCVPSFTGLGAPYWEPRATAHIEGMTLTTGPGDIVHAVLEGIAIHVTTLVRSVEADLARPLTSLRVDGGLTHSSVLLQLQADLLQMPVELFASPHATALGIASLACVGSGHCTSLAPGRRDEGRRFEPKISPSEAQERLERWAGAAERVRAAVPRSEH